MKGEVILKFLLIHIIEKFYQIFMKVVKLVLL